MSHKIEHLQLPVCNSFQAMILNDQLCYEVDLNDFSENKEHKLQSGFVFIMDYNEDKQVLNDKDDNQNERSGLVRRIVNSNYKQKATIHLNTIRKCIM